MNLKRTFRSTFSARRTLTILPFDYDVYPVVSSVTNKRLEAYISNRPRSNRNRNEVRIRKCADSGEGIRFTLCFQSDRPDQDFIYILAAVRERAENKDVHWSRLVDAGVIDALCECVLHAKTRPLDLISGSRLRIETSVRPL